MHREIYSVESSGTCVWARVKDWFDGLDKCLVDATKRCASDLISPSHPSNLPGQLRESLSADIQKQGFCGRGVVRYCLDDP